MTIFFDFNPVRSLCGMASSDINPESIMKIFGDPDEVEKGQNSADEEASIVYHFQTHQLTLFFTVEGLVCFAVANPGFKMFGENIFELREDEIIFLFKNNGFPEHEIDANWGEKQLVFEKAGVTVFFDNQDVSEIFIDM